MTDRTDAERLAEMVWLQNDVNELRRSIADMITTNTAMAQERDAATREAEALREEVGRLREAVDFAHGWIGGLPREPSFEDKRAAQAALESVGAIWRRSREEAPAQPNADDVERARLEDSLQEASRVWYGRITPWSTVHGRIEALAKVIQEERAAARAEGARQMRELILAYGEKECFPLEDMEAIRSLPLDTPTGDEG